MESRTSTPVIIDTPSHLSIDGLIIDTRTGEILGHDETPSVFTGATKYKCELGKCRSVDDFEEHLSFVDRRKLPPHKLHSLRNEVDYAHGEWRRTNTDCRITIPQLRLLEKLHGLVLYRNIIMTTQADLAKSLGTAESNLMKKLRVLTDSQMLRVFTSRNSDIRMGEMKLCLNPRLIFRGTEHEQDRYINAWYRPATPQQAGMNASAEAPASIAIAA